MAMGGFYERSKFVKRHKQDESTFLEKLKYIGKGRSRLFVNSLYLYTNI